MSIHADHNSIQKIAGYIAAAGGTAAIASSASGQILSESFNIPVNVNGTDQLIDMETLSVQPYTEVNFQDDEWDVRIRASSYAYTPPVYFSYYGYTYYRPGGYISQDERNIADAGSINADVLDEDGLLLDAFGDNAASFGEFVQPGDRIDASYPFGRVNTRLQIAGVDNGLFEDLQNLEFIVPVKVEDGYGWVRYRIEDYTVIVDIDEIPQNIKNVTIVDAAFNHDGGIIAGQAIAPAECAAETTGDELVNAEDVNEFLSRLGVRINQFREEFDQSADLAEPFSGFVSTDAFDLFRYLELIEICGEN